MVQEGQGVILCQSYQPERDLGQIHGHGVAIHTVNTPLGNQSARKNHFVFI